MTCEQELCLYKATQEWTSVFEALLNKWYAVQGKASATRDFLGGEPIILTKETLAEIKGSVRR